MMITMITIVISRDGDNFDRIIVMMMMIIIMITANDDNGTTMMNFSSRTSERSENLLL